MKRDLRLSHDRSNVSRSDYIKETEQPTIVGDLSITEMKFDNCLDQVEGELSYRNAKAEHYEEYLNDKKEKSNGNLWRYLRDVQNLYEGSHLSKQARTWNLELLEKTQNIWFSWVEQIPYPGIQGYCLFYAPSLDCFIDFIKYLQEENDSQKSEKIDHEQNQILVMLLISQFIDHIVTIEGNIEYDNRMSYSPEKWDIVQWKNKETVTYIQVFIDALLKLPHEIIEPIIYDMLSDEWIFEKKTLRDQYRKKFRDTFLELIAEHYKGKLADIIQSDLWKSSKASLYHRLSIYYYWVESNDAVSSEIVKNIQDVLWIEWKKVMYSDTHMVYMTYNSEDGFWLLWLSGKLMSDEENMGHRFDGLLSGINRRLDGWNNEYENSRHTSDIIFCLFTVAAMAGEWKGKQANENENVEGFYWYIFEKANKFARGNRYLDEVAQKSLSNIWSRMVLLSKQNPFISKKDFMWENIRNIDSYEYRVYILDSLLYNVNLKKMNWSWDEQLKQNFLSILIEEKDILDKEKSADPSYYERYYRREGEALERCLSFLSRK